MDTNIYLHELRCLARRVDKTLTDAGVEYFAVYGTCLGAVRHHDIIPWDGDIDLAVKRDRFLDAVTVLRDKDSQVYVGALGEFDGCPRMYARIFNRINKHSSIEKRRAYLDLYVIDAADDNIIFSSLKVFAMSALNRIVERRIMGRCGHQHPIAYALADILGFPFRLLSSSRLLKISDCIYLSSRGKKFIKITGELSHRYLASSFAESLRMQFADMELPIPVGYDVYLTEKYGDWRTPPPACSRVNSAFINEDGEWSVAIPPDDLRQLKENS